MAMKSEVTGNVLTAPVLKTVKVAGKDQTICEIRIMSATLKREADGSYAEVKDKTFPVQGTLWNEKRAKRVFDHVKVGAEVTLTGATYFDAWKDDKGEPHAEVRMDVDTLSLGLIRVDAVKYREKSARDESDTDPVPEHVPY